MGGFTPSIPTEWCTLYSSAVAFVAQIMSWVLGSGLITMRVYLLYKNSMRHGAILFGLLWVACWLPGLVMDSIAQHSWLTESPNLYSPLIRMCGFFNSRPPWFWTMWAPPMVFEATVCTLLVYKAYQDRQLLLGTVSKLMSCLLRDGIFFNVVLFALQTVNMVFYLIFPNSLFSIGFIPTWAISVMLITRIHLSLRGVANPSDWTRATSVGNNAQPNNGLPADVRMRQNGRSAESSDWSVWDRTSS